MSDGVSVKVNVSEPAPIIPTPDDNSTENSDEITDGEDIVDDEKESN